MKKKHKVIIIGGGIGGLISGCYLAKSGVDTLIVEKNDRVGGCFISFKRGGFNFDGGAQIMGSCNNGGILRSLLESLNVHPEVIRLQPSDLAHFPGDVVDFDSDLRKFMTYLQGRFKKEKRSIELFFGLLKTATDKEKVLFIMKKYALCTYQELLDQYFKDDILKSILSVQSGCLGLPPNKLSAVSAIFLLKTFIVDGAYYPKGGAQKFSDAIAKAFMKFGGTLRLNSAADRIIVENNRIRGIMMRGEAVSADVVISAFDMVKTYNRLIRPKNEKFLAKLNKFRLGSSCCILYLGLSEYADLRRQNGWYYPSYNVNRDFERLINVHIPTLYDDTLTNNKQKILIATFPFDIKDDRKHGRGRFKEELSEKFLDRVESRIPDIRKNIVLKELATPLTIERYTSNSNASLYGWRQSPTQTHMNCFPAQSYIRGLFHAGHWTLPGGGIVASAVSGVNAARKVLKYKG